MGTLKDFTTSMASDLMLPFFKTTLEDVVFDILNEREIPNRTQFGEVRDLVNGIRGPVTSATNTLKKLESRLAALEQKVDAQALEIAALREPTTPKARKAAPKAKKAAPKVKPTAKKSNSA